VELDTLHDVFSKQAIKHIQQLQAYTLPDLQQECRLWQAVPVFCLQLLSPIRLLKDKQQRLSLKGEARYCQQTSDLTAELISNRLYDYFAALISKQNPASQPARLQPVPLTLTNTSQVHWQNIHYTDSSRTPHAMGGMLGEITLSIDEPETFDWTLWVLGQYTGIGQRSSFGFGRYRLQPPDAHFSLSQKADAASLSANNNPAPQTLHSTTEPDSNNPASDDDTPYDRQEINADANSQAKQYGERDQYGMLLCISGKICQLHTANDHLQVEREEQLVYDVPWRHLQAVLLLGSHNITTPALLAAMEQSVPIHFASQTGKYRGMACDNQAGAKGCELWLKQQQTFSQPEQALAISREIVGARLFNIRETLRLRTKLQHSAQLDVIIKKLPAAQSLAELNGFEGSATRLYFAALKEILPAEFSFNDRNRQPPLDPFNALLSLGYSTLYSCLESILRANGLFPWLGVYHQPHGKHATLASDLMEPFRHVVERLALALVHRHELKTDDFYITADNACYLQKNARNFYLSSLMAKFEANGIFELIHQQNLSLIRCIEQGESFKAWRVR
jgi:CRISPR-associated endonuclease Cas1